MTKTTNSLRSRIFTGENGRANFLAELATIARASNGISKSDLIRAIDALVLAADGFTQAGRVIGVHAEIIRAAVMRKHIYPALLSALKLEENERTYRVKKSGNR